MASLVVLTVPPTEIEYSISNNQVRLFKLRGKTLYSRHDGIEVDGWEKWLASFVVEQKLNIDRGEGLNAFVYDLIDKGLISA